jgi:hypothetical protein
LVQRRDQQEGEQHLNARQRDAQLAHALVEIAVVPLEFGFAATPLNGATRPLAGPESGPWVRRAMGLPSFWSILRDARSDRSIVPRLWSATQPAA